MALRQRIVDEPTDALLKRLVVSQGAVPLGFELFPPRGAERREALWTTVERLAPVADAGFSVTMGAGGTTRAGTHDTAIEVARRSRRPVTAHLTALGLSKDHALETATAFWTAGITRILALRGDRPLAPQGPLPAGFAHASDLVAALAARHDFEITVAAYPEKHPEAATLGADIDHLKEKLDAGAKAAVCQFVLDPAAYGRFLEACARHGIDAPIVPGVMPLEGWNRVRAFAIANGASVPDWLDRLFSRGEETPELMPYLSAAATLEHARRLVAYGAPSLHVYAMNRWPLPLALARLLGH
jgi:methylenetetrahydrofolate reductase (NADPH)